MLFTPAGGLILLGKCAHTNTHMSTQTHPANDKTEKIKQKSTKRCSTLALAVHMNWVRAKEKKKHLQTPADSTANLPLHSRSYSVSSPQFWHELQVLSISVKSVLCSGRLLISMLRCSEVWATTILLNSDSLVSSCCSSSTHYLGVSK